MALNGIDELVFGVEDMDTCRRFFNDWGLQENAYSPEKGTFATLDGSQVTIEPHLSANLPPAIEAGSTLRRVIFGVTDDQALSDIRNKLQQLDSYGEDGGLASATDPNGLRLSFRVRTPQPVAVQSSPMNTAENPTARRNERGTVYERATPVKIGHFVLFSPDVTAAVDFYTNGLGFVVSDYYPDAGYFLRCAREGGHHDLFMLQTPDHKCGLNHVAFTVRDIHEVFGGGLHISSCGWETQIGPGRHPISSAYFWYVHNPAGALAEYYSDEDWCDADWAPKAWERTPEHYAEWAIAGGIDHKTRRQARSK